MPRIFSGIQPSGNLHLGNYLGAIQNWVKLQSDFDSLFCVVDLHAITVPQNPEQLKNKILEVAKIYLAAGIDPQKSTIFVQSHVKEHTELAWILNTIAKIPELEKMTQFKDKATQHKENLNVGLFDYPVLMAADILLYDTDIVPVGKDQLQHVELARTLARRFNNNFGEIFKIPEAKIKKEGARIMGLDDSTKKMSKSAKSEYNYIALTDSPEIIKKKISKAVTDSGSEIKAGTDKPALTNLLNIYSLLSDKSIKDIEKEYDGKSYAQFKNGLAQVTIDFLSKFQQNFNNLEGKQVLSILQAGAQKAQRIASDKIDQVKKAVGLG